jgi:hypothetical protein
MRDAVRRLLVWSLGGTVLLPVVLAVVFGLGGLLASLGDATGAGICRGVSLVLGAAWAVALAGTVLTTALVTLESLEDSRGRASDPGAGPDPSGAEARPVPSRPDPF